MEDGDNNRIRLKIEIETQWTKLIKNQVKSALHCSQVRGVFNSITCK